MYKKRLVMERRQVCKKNMFVCWKPALSKDVSVLTVSPVVYVEMNRRY